MGKQATIRADGVTTETKILVAFCECWFVDNDSIAAAADRPPVPFAIFRARIEGIPVDERAVLLRHACIVVLHPAPHLGE